MCPFNDIYPLFPIGLLGENASILSYTVTVRCNMTPWLLGLHLMLIRGVARLNLAVGHTFL